MVLKLYHYNYRVMLKLQERLQSESQHHQSEALLEILFSLINHQRLDTLVGFIQNKTLGEDLVLYPETLIQHLLVLIRSASAPQIQTQP